MGVVREGGASQGVQASHLVFLPALVVDTRPLARRPCLEAATIDGHRHRLRDGPGRLRAAVVQPVLGTLVPGLPQLLTELFGQGSDVSGADGNFGQAFEHAGGQRKGFELAAGLDDFQEDSRAVSMGVKAQQRTLREKNPADRRGSGRPVRGGGTSRL